MCATSYDSVTVTYGNLLAEKCYFFLPPSYSAPLLHMLPLEDHGEFQHEETRVIGLSFSEDHMIILTIPACDGRTDGQIYHSQYSILHSKLC